MIKTGLPYDFDIMDKIAEEGAVVDVSQTNYPFNENIERTTLIYLRNTGYKNITLDFSNVSYESKEKYLIEYLTGDIDFSINELTDSLIKIFAQYKGILLDINSILNDEEEKQFINNNNQLLNELNSFTYSLPLFSISRLQTEDFTFVYDDIKKTDYKFCQNVCSLIEHPYWNLFYELEPQTEPVFYTNMFTENNNKLFEVIMKHTPFSVLLYGMGNPEQWKEFSNLLKEYEEKTYD